MSPDLMRFIDRWAGAPLCLLLTVFDRLAGLFFGGKKPLGPPKSILFVELAEIGGLVVAYPCLARAREKFPGADLYFLTFKAGQGILGLMNIIDREHQIIIRPDNLWAFAKTTLAAILKMRRLGIDATVNLEGYARFSTMLCYLIGAPRRAGFHPYHEEGHNMGGLITHKVIYNPHVHAAQTFITLVEALGEEPDGEPRAKVSLGGASLDVPRVETGDEARQRLLAKIKGLCPAFDENKKLVLINPNASDLVAARRWPTENFLSLGKGLLKEGSVVIGLTGTAGERDHAEAVRLALESDRVVNMAGRTTLPELIDLYNLASLLVTNDSGPAHFASLTDLPVLVMFGPETPAIYGPLGPGVEVIYKALACSPCVSAYNQKRSPCSDNKCLTSITPAEVLVKAREILGFSDN